MFNIKESNPLAQREEGIIMANVCCKNCGSPFHATALCNRRYDGVASKEIPECVGSNDGYPFRNCNSSDDLLKEKKG